LQTMFRYNWMVREDWYRWCEDVTEEELLSIRTGGVGGILHTLFHIIDVEWSWIRFMQGKSDFQESFEGYRSLERVRELDVAFRPEVETFVFAWDESMENRLFYEALPDGSKETYAWGEVMRHVIAHEIHHVGQLSIWAREIGKKPISANLIGRGLITTQPGRF
jgi:uncharacterized damage-inducible protein DinB